MSGVYTQKIKKGQLLFRRFRNVEFKIIDTRVRTPLYMHRRSFTRVLGRRVGQVEPTSGVMGPAHELDGHLVASGLNQLFDLRAQPAVLHCNTGGTEKRF